VGVLYDSSEVGMREIALRLGDEWITREMKRDMKNRYKCTVHTA
jgi:hypothetical protein